MNIHKYKYTYTYKYIYPYYQQIAYFLKMKGDKLSRISFYRIILFFFK